MPPSVASRCPWSVASLPLPAEAVVDPRIGSSGPACWRSRMASSSRRRLRGRRCAAAGDLVVNTSQTGYQEVCTDPSYAGQVVVMTFPLIGNHGRAADDDQSERPWLRRARGGPRHGRRAGPGAPDRAPAALPRCASHRRAGHAARWHGTCAPAARSARRHHGARRGGPGGRRRCGAADAALGGRRTSSRGCRPQAPLRGRRSWAGRGGRGPGPQDEHHPLAPPARGPSAGAAPHGRRRAGPGG